MNPDVDYKQLVKKRLQSSLTVLLLVSYFVSNAQVGNTFYIHGNAFENNCNCYTLTPDKGNQIGSVWNQNEIDLTQPFDFNFDIFLGCLDSGADGSAFVLQTSSSALGTPGEGLGFGGLSPSIGITIDTHQNTDDHDPPYNHLAIQKNGDLNHQSPDNLAGPIAARPDSISIEDCQWHILHVIWDPVTQILSAQIDGLQKVSVNIDLVNQVFSGNPIVFWGFTGATGAKSNLQKFCTALNPLFTIPAGQKTCYTQAIQFVDSSISFGKISKWYWSFGDGTIDSVDQDPPPHSYSTPGIYTPELSILGMNGCLSDTFSQQILIGSKPIAQFGNSLTCAGSPTFLSDSSTVQFGTLDEWIWSNKSGSLNLDTTQGGLLRLFPSGPQTVMLVVGSKEGCLSDTTSHTFEVYAIPSASMAVANACADQPDLFSATNTNPAVPITQWYWLPGDGSLDSTQTVQHVYTKQGQYLVGLFVSNNGCFSDTINQSITIYKTTAFAGQDTSIVSGQPLQLNGSGGLLYSWSPAAGLNNADIADPVALLENDQTYILTAYTPIGCATTDTIQIKVFKGPAIYVPNAFTPNNDGRNDRFRCITVGITAIYFFNIYNRYGQLIYSSTDSKQGWDGSFQGKAQPSGTYVWMVKGIDYNGVVHSGKGTVTLLR
jgi:gliding motility-associated-like protein